VKGQTIPKMHKQPEEGRKNLTDWAETIKTFLAHFEEKQLFVQTES
jgi:hypothetical protein